MKKIFLFAVQLIFTSSISGQNKLILFNANLIDGIANVEKRNMMIFISNGKIESVKKDGIKPKGYELVDLNGMYLLPGFIDAHFHLKNFGKRLDMLNLKGIRSLDEIILLIKKKIEALNANQWLIGFGWDQNLWDKKNILIKIY
mgnify:CR=1 FL=1